MAMGRVFETHGHVAPSSTSSALKGSNPHPVIFHFHMKMIYIHYVQRLMRRPHGVKGM